MEHTSKDLFLEGLLLLLLLLCLQFEILVQVSIEIVFLSSTNTHQKISTVMHQGIIVRHDSSQKSTKIAKELP